MGIEVKVTTDASLVPRFAAARRRAVLAGGEVGLELAIEGAPKRTDAMIQSGRVEFDLSPDGADGAAIIFGVFYAQFEETKEEYKHPVGHAHFLELAVVGGAETILGRVARVLRESEL